MNNYHSVITKIVAYIKQKYQNNLAVDSKSMKPFMTLDLEFHLGSQITQSCMSVCVCVGDEIADHEEFTNSSHSCQITDKELMGLKRESYIA